MPRRYDPSDIPPTPDLRFENALWIKGLTCVAGIDEAGRGAWAGPVAAGAVILPPEAEIAKRLHRVRDSKQMQPKERTFWAEAIKDSALAWGVGLATNQEIDALGIVPATRLAMSRALDALSTPPQHLLIDALLLKDIQLPQTSIIKGDARSLSIAAASVLAKTTRDCLMIELDQVYPVYGFARHKGYGTSIHRDALTENGPCAIHRLSFAPIKQTSGE